MAKIENTTVYPIKSPPIGRDYFIITDVEDDNSTKNCLIGDLTSSINIYELEVTVSSSHLLLIGTNMFTLITGVPGKYIVPMSIIAKLEIGTVAYEFPVSGEIGITTASAGGGSYAYILGDFLNSPADNITAGTGKGLRTVDAPGLVAGESLVLWGANAVVNPTVGDGQLKINIQYRLASI